MNFIHMQGNLLEDHLKKMRNDSGLGTLNPALENLNKQLSDIIVN